MSGPREGPVSGVWGTVVAMSDVDQLGHILDGVDTSVLSAPDLYNLVTSVKPLADHWPALLGRIADQLDARVEAGGLTHDGGEDPAAAAAHASATLRAAALAVREAIPALDDAHNTLSHLGER